MLDANLFTLRQGRALPRLCCIERIYPFDALRIGGAREKRIAQKLLIAKLVFVGDSIVELLLDKDYPLPPRATKDVDTIVEVYGRGSFAQVEKELRKLGFKNDVMSNVICRWEIEGVTLDVMPTDSSALGFSNIWYESAVKYAKQYFLASELDILLITAPYFLATKIEAFESRGEGDFYGSHDLEDVITLLDGRESLLNDIAESDSDLKSYLVKKFTDYQKNTHFINALPGHLSPYQTGTDERGERLEKIISKLAEIQ